MVPLAEGHKAVARAGRGNLWDGGAHQPNVKTAPIGLGVVPFERE